MPVGSAAAAFASGATSFFTASGGRRTSSAAGISRTQAAMPITIIATRQS
jgi:hypothetical protein